MSTGNENEKGTPESRVNSIELKPGNELIVLIRLVEQLNANVVGLQTILSEFIGELRNPK
jgi:hypothetical protein